MTIFKSTVNTSKCFATPQKDFEANYAPLPQPRPPQISLGQHCRRTVDNGRGEGPFYPETVEEGGEVARQAEGHVSEARGAGVVLDNGGVPNASHKLLYAMVPITLFA